MRLGMVIDLDKCIGCRSCTVSCKAHNAQPPGTWWNRVFTPGSTFHQNAVEKNGHFQMNFLPVSCQMCDNAPCEKVCPAGATYTDERGVILVDYERCVGCRYCIASCPYNVRQFNWADPQKVKKRAGYKTDYEYGYPAQIRDKNGRLVYIPNRPIGIVEKCTFCFQYTSKDELPACVRSCPSKARIFGDLDDPESDVNRLIRDRQAFRLKEELGTQPKVYYLPASKPNR
jgi:dimethyl sulfoxide reductase iron-sulfur subunit